MDHLPLVTALFYAEVELVIGVGQWNPVQLRMEFGNQIFRCKACTNAHGAQLQQRIQIFRLGLDGRLQLLLAQELTAEAAANIIGNAQRKRTAGERRIVSFQELAEDVLFFIAIDLFQQPVRDQKDPALAIEGLQQDVCCLGQIGNGQIDPAILQ